MFEELNNVGQLDTYPRRLSVMRSRAMQVCHIVQSLAQFKNRYPDEQWAEIVGNCDTQILLGCTEEQTAEYFSARSGDMTVDVGSTMVVKKTIAVTQMINTYRETAGMGKRRLLTPDEVFRLPNSEMLIILRGEKVLRAEKFDFTGHPYAKRMVKTSVYNYYPESNPAVSQTEVINPQINTPPCQTETQNHLESREAKTPPDYLGLMAAAQSPPANTKRQSQAAKKQSGNKSNPEEPTIPLITLAEQSVPDVPSHTGANLYGDDLPPDDF